MKLRRLLQYLRPKDSRSTAEKDFDGLLVRDAINRRNEIKVILLGDQLSGKSTFLKHMNYLYLPETKESTKIWRGTIYENLLLRFQELLELVEELHGNKNPDLTAKIERFRACVDKCVHRSDWERSPFPPEAARLINQLLEESVVQYAFMTGYRSITVFEPHSLAYSLASLNRLLVESYVPSVEDCLNVQLSTSGITEWHVHIDPFTYKLFDTGGARSERKKWIHTFDNADVLLFFVPLNCYGSGMGYETGGNRMAESLLMFESLARSRFFENTTIVLLLNRVKLFREQIISGASPIKRYFPEYQGDPLDVHTAQEFFTDKFRTVFPPKLGELSVLAINAVEANDIRKVMEHIHRTISTRRGVSG